MPGTIMMSRPLTRALGALVTALAVPTFGAAAKPNVLFILTDDQDIMLGSMDPEGPMQNTRRLIVDKGAWFNNGFANTPICCPSRAEITTGRFMHNTKVYGNDCGEMDFVNGPEKLNMATYMKKAGYATFYAGKYLNNYGTSKVGGCARQPAGWDQWYGLVGNSKYYDYDVCDNGKTVHHGSDYATDYFTDRLKNRTMEFLANVTMGEAPFFAMIGTPASHGPNDPAPQYSETYAGRKSPRLPSWNVAPNPDKHSLLRHILPMDQQHANVSDVFFQRRWSVLRSVDDMVATFHAKLTAAGKIDNTYFMYTSDHGYHLGEFGMLYDKRMLYETDIRVPVFVSGPRIKPGQVIEHMVGHVDLAPTILSMGGVAAPPQMDGHSWLALVAGATAQAQTQGWRKTFMVEYSGGGTPELAGKEASCEDKHWFHSFNSAAYNATCGADASDELSVWGKCSCTATFGQSSEKHDQSPCDSANNTYACIRTLETGASSGLTDSFTAGGGNYTHNTIYCEFADAENFKEYYDLNKDPFNLHNTYTQLSPAEQQRLAAQLKLHKACTGAGCFM